MRILAQLLLSLVFLTRLPLPSFVHEWLGRRDIRLAESAWSFPLIGGFIGLVAAGAMLGLGYIGVPVGLQILVALGVGIILSGALHEDGFADFFDGLGVYDKGRALEVMHDSRVGSFGALALIFSFCWRGIALYELSLLGSHGGYLALGLFLSHVGGRGFMAGLLFLPMARTDGLASKAGRAGLFGVIVALSISALIFIGLLPLYEALICLAVTGVCVVVLGIVAMHRYGGMTGDIYGAGEQVGEMAVLGALVSCLT